jgi:hypothetical protein
MPVATMTPASSPARMVTPVLIRGRGYQYEQPGARPPARC